MLEMTLHASAGRRLTASLLALTLLVGLSASPVDAKKADKKREADYPVRDFLPPVATINGKLTPQSAAGEDADDLEVVSLTAVQTPTLHKTPRIKRLTDDLSVQSEELKSLRALQTQVDTANLDRLWEATVERNPVIRFSLEKVATPADIQTKHSSLFLRKTLSTLIQGAALYGTSMTPGGGAYRDMMVMSGANVLNNLVTGRTQPTPNSLSPTEQIQLAGLIDELKIKLIHTYQEYKNTLQSLAQSHDVTMKNNNLYSQALASKNDLAIMAAGTAYYQSLNQEMALRQKAKLARLQLERLAGAGAVSSLQLAVTVSTEPETAHVTPAPAEEGLAAPLEIAPSLHEEVGPAEPIGPLAPSPFNQSRKAAGNGLEPIPDTLDRGGPQP